MANWTASYGRYVTLKVTATEVEVNTANNTSKVRVQSSIYYGGGTRATNNYPQTLSVSVNGSSIGNQTGITYSLSSGGTKTLNTYTSGAITHNADGSKSVNVTVKITDNKGDTGTISQTLTLTKIARASTPTLSASSVAIGSSVTINTNRASSSFTHTITYKFGSMTKTVATKTTSASVAWTVPNDLATQIPNDTSGWGSFTVTTYSGNTAIGSKNINLTLTVPSNSTFNPTITAPAVSEAVSSVTSAVGSVYVQGKSKFKLTATPTTRQGATVKSVVFTVKSSTHTASGSGSGKAYTATTGFLSDTGAHAISVKVTDSRGRTATANIASQPSVLAYSNPRITSFTAVRNATTSTTVNISRVFTYSIVGSNSVSYSITRQQSGSSTVTTVQSGTLTSGSSSSSTPSSTGTADANSWTFKLTVSDKFGSATASVSVATAGATMSWGKNGIAVGGIYDNGIGGGLQVSGLASFSGNVQLTNNHANITINPSSGHGNIEIGSTFATSTPFIDFHSSGTTSDYDSRIIAKNGSSSNGQGTLELLAGNVSVPKNATFGGNIGHTGERFTFANNTQLYWNDTGGTSRRVLHKGTDNWTHINPDGHGGTHFYGQVRSQGDLLSTTNSNLGKVDYRWGTVWTSGHGQPSTSNTTSAVGLGIKGGNSLMTMGIGSAANDRNGWIQVRHSENSFSTTYGNLYLQKLGGTTYTGGNFTVSGSKNAVHVTRDGPRLTPAYETAESYLGDIGEDSTGYTSEVKVDIEVLFQDTVNTEIPYQVFLQSYGNGHVWVSERNKDYFIVKSSSPNIPFAWELKAKRRGYENDRLVLSEIGFEEMQVLEGLHGGYSNHVTKDAEIKEGE